MATSTEYLAELSTTELIMLKDGIDLEVERLDLEAREATEANRLQNAKTLLEYRNIKRDLAWKMSVILDTRLEEERPRRTA